MPSDLLLLSNSTNSGAALLAHAPLAEFYGDREVLFVPYALANFDAYADAVQEPFAAAGLRLRGLHTSPNPTDTADAAEAFFVGGGNSFRLLRALQRHRLLDAVRAAVARGARYGGASAGANVACPTIRTTNDMPIVEPAGLAALGLVPFQINPHYLDTEPESAHMGGTREERLEEFLEDNDVPVVGLREGGWLRVADGRVTLHQATARLLRRGYEPTEHAPGSELSFLLGIAPAFDVRDT
jgi:dipeptidase E